MQNYFIFFYFFFFVVHKNVLKVLRFLSMVARSVHYLWVSICAERLARAIVSTLC